MNYDFILSMLICLCHLLCSLLFLYLKHSMWDLSFIYLFIFALPQVHPLVLPLGAYVSDELTLLRSLEYLFCPYS